MKIARLHPFIDQFIPATEIPFSKDEANRFLPWIIGFMFCLTGIALALSISFSSSLLQWNRDLEGRFTVQIPASKGSETARAEQVAALLKKQTEVASVEIVSQREMESLISPWMGNADTVLEELPLPKLLEVTLKDGASVDMQMLSEQIRNIAPQAEIDDYQVWMAKFKSLVRTVNALALVFALLIAAVVLAIVVLSARTALRLHHKTVELLYTIGAEHHYIARQFQSNAVLLICKGALPGLLAAAIIFWLMCFIANGLDAPLLPALRFSALHIGIFLLLPLMAALAAMFSTRYAVTSMLRQQY